MNNGRFRRISIIDDSELRRVVSIGYMDKDRLTEVERDSDSLSYLSPEVKIGLVGH